MNLLPKEDYEILKLQFDDNLSKALSSISNFLKKFESFKKFNNDINKLICEHQIHKNQKKLNQFTEIISNAETSLRQQTIEVQEQSEMKQRRKEELKQINNLIEANIQKLLPPDNSKDNKNNLLPCSFDLSLSIKNESSFSFSGNNKGGKIIKLLKKKRIKANNEKKEKKKKLREFEKKNPNSLICICYICKKKLFPDDVHKFYGNICKKCGDYNYSFRDLKLDCSGRIAIVTGGRVKIGYYIATKLLSYGCKVLTTSRFPKDTLLKYQQHPDYETWKNNFQIYPIDFRIGESVNKFIDYIKNNYPHIDILINNAAQTIRKTTAYYKYLLPIETKELKEEDEKKIIKNDYIFKKQFLLESDDELDKTKNIE